MILPFLIATIKEKIASGKSKDDIVTELKSHGYSMEDLVDTWASMENPVLTPDAKQLDFVVTATPIEARKGPAQPLVATSKQPPPAPAAPVSIVSRPTAPLPQLKQPRSGPSLLTLIISFIVIPFLGAIAGYILSQTSWLSLPSFPFP